jgi:hypothetical protein
MRALVAVMLLGCGGASKQAATAPPPTPVETQKAETPPPPPPPAPEAPRPEPVPAQVAEAEPDRGGDPCEGGEAAPGGEGGAGVGHGVGGGGSGYGAGIGGLRGRNQIIPRVKLGKGTASEGLQIEIIARYIRRNLGRYRYCYEKELLAKPGLKGKASLAFAIDAQGNVTTAEAKVAWSAAVAGCLADATKLLQFPKPAKAPVTVTYPFEFYEQ